MFLRANNQYAKNVNKRAKKLFGREISVPMLTPISIKSFVDVNRFEYFIDLEFIMHGKRLNDFTYTEREVDLWKNWRYTDTLCRCIYTDKLLKRTVDGFERRGRCVKIQKCIFVICVWNGCLGFLWILSDKQNLLFPFSISLFSLCLFAFISTQNFITT